MIEESDYKPGGRPITGRMALLMLLAFFGAMFLINFIMAGAAVKTFSGQEGGDPYDTGLAYNNEIAAAKAQAALGWKVDITRVQDGPAQQFTTMVKDKAGKPISGLKAEMHFFFPATRKFDQEVVAVPVAAGVYTGSVVLRQGRWMVQTDLIENGKRKFRSRNHFTVE